VQHYNTCIFFCESDGSNLFEAVEMSFIVIQTESAVCGRYVVPIRKCVRPLQQLTSFVCILVCSQAFVAIVVRLGCSRSDGMW